MKPFSLRKKTKYDKAEYKRLLKDNPGAAASADKAFFANHPDINQQHHPFKVHRPGQLSDLDLLNLFGVKGERKKIGQLREEYWAYLQEAEVLEMKVEDDRQPNRPVARCKSKKCQIGRLKLQCRHGKDRDYVLSLPPDDKTWRNNPNRRLEIVGGGTKGQDKIGISLATPNPLPCPHHKGTSLLVRDLEEKRTFRPLPGTNRPKTESGFTASSTTYEINEWKSLFSALKPKRYLVCPKACNLEEDGKPAFKSAIVVVYPDVAWDIDLEINLIELLGISGGLPFQNFGYGVIDLATGGKQAGEAIWQGKDSVLSHLSTTGGQAGVKGKFLKTVNGESNDFCAVRTAIRIVNDVFGVLRVAVGVLIFLFEVINMIVSKSKGEDPFFAKAGFDGPIGGWGLSGGLVLLSTAKFRYKSKFEECKASWRVGRVYEWSLGFDPLIRLRVALDITGLIIQIISFSTASSGVSPIAAYIVNKLRSMALGSVKGHLGVQWDVLAATLTLTGAVSGTIGREKPHPDKPARQKEDAGLSVKGKIDGVLDVSLLRSKGVCLKYGWDFGSKGVGTTAISIKIENQIETGTVAGKEVEKGVLALEAAWHGLYFFLAGWVSAGSSLALFHDTGEKPSHMTEEWADKVLEDRVKKDLEDSKDFFDSTKPRKTWKEYLLGIPKFKFKRPKVRTTKSEEGKPNAPSAFSMGSELSFKVIPPVQLPKMYAELWQE